MDSAYARVYRDLYERHWWWRARECLLVKTLRRIAPVGGFSSILDVGCGDGLFFDRLSAFGSVEGVESDASLIDPEGKHRSRIHVAPFDRRFQPGKRYSLILMLDVFEHLDDPEGALRHAATLLEAHGTLLATVPAFQLLWTKHDEINHHHTRFTKRSFLRLARHASIEIRETRYFFHWLFAAKLAVRLAETIRRRASSSASLPPRFINRALYLLSRSEQTLLGKVQVPFGTSLLVIAQSRTAASTNGLARA